MKINVDNIRINYIEPKELDEYLNLVSVVKENMEHPEWLGDFSKEDYINILNNDGYIRIFKYDDKMIAAGVLIPSTQKYLEKFLSGQLSCNEVIDYGPQMVHPNYVGNGIQTMIIKDLDYIARQKGYKYALGTVHPENIYSINNLLKNDFIKIGEVQLKRGLRNIYRKEL